MYASLNSFLPANDSNTTGKPKAYLNWILLDNQFRYVGYPSSGAIPVGSPDELNTLANSSKITKSGYLYIWVSNETPAWDAFFDNLSVRQYSGPFLEETHYYPFGLTMAGISDKAIKTQYVENKYRFNGGNELQNREFSDGSGLELYDATFRLYDPQIGRFGQIDPLAEIAESGSPYSFVGNNPLSFADPLGLSDSLLPEVTVYGYKPPPPPPSPTVNVGPPPATPTPGAEVDPGNSSNQSEGNSEQNTNYASTASFAIQILHTDCSSIQFIPVGPDKNYQIAGSSNVYFDWYTSFPREDGKIVSGMAHFQFPLLYFEMPHIRAGRRQIITGGMASTIIAKIIDAIDDELDASEAAHRNPKEFVIQNESLILNALKKSVMTFGGRVTKESYYGIVPALPLHKSLFPSVCN